MPLDAASSSSSAQLIPPKKYDVFISFRGEDTRTNFTSHLYHAFCKKQIKTYIDNEELHKGDEISAALMQAIEDSYVSVVVFSENYASSRWCLDELTHILLCKRDQGQLVIPVFYKVEPSHVRNQIGLYKEAFEKHERDLMVDQHKMQMWKDDLTKAANLAGWGSHEIRDESELIQKIVKDILQKLNHRYPPTELKGLVGLDDIYAEIELLLREVQTIGIWGMGGIGKTTVAKALFVKYSSHYEGCCFLANVRENFGKHDNGINNLRHELISCLLEEDLFMGTSTTFIEHRLSRKRVFIVLDDVSTLKQLEYLVGEIHCFGQGSKIIITTRDKHVLSKGVDIIYKVKELKFKESLKLFSLNAFNQNLPKMEYKEISERIVVYARGIPLALKVLGSFLRNKSENEWNSALRKLGKTPHEDIQKVLRLSYDGLNHEEKEIFLDIACFLKGELKEYMMNLLDSYGFYGAIGIKTLHDKALINAYDYKHVEMHDLLQEMGWQIIREESMNKPERHSRLWDSKEIYDVLANNKGTNKVEGIKLDASQIGDLHLSTDTFKKMPNLRFVKVYNSLNNGSSHIHLPRGFKFFPDKIRYLEWYGYSLKSLPFTFCPEKLVVLRMPHSHVQKLWNGVQDLVNLKEINFDGSKQLIELPDFSKAINLVVVSLTDCESLRSIHPSVLSLHSLVKLKASGCKKLQSLKSGFQLKSLEFVTVEDCSNLKEFGVSSEKLTMLFLNQVGIEILHPSIGFSSNLEELDLRCSRLKSLPNELSCLRNLVSLNVPNCKVIDNSKLHIFFDGMLSLVEVCLDGCSNITELPSNTEHLLRLKRLYIRNCKRLRSLPKLPPSIIDLEADDCKSLETVSTSRLLSRSGIDISFGNCVKLNGQSLRNISEDAYSAMIGATYGYELARDAQDGFSRDSIYDRSSIWFPGSGIPEWFKYRTTRRTIIIELPQNVHLLGFAFCAALFYLESRIIVTFKCVFYLGEFKVLDLQSHLYSGLNRNSDHVCIWHDGFLCSEILKEIERIRGKRQSVTPLKLSFEFSEFNVAPCKEIIKEYGVCPLYTAEYEELVRQEELERNKKRPRTVDEQQPLPQSKKLKQDFGTHTNTLLNRICVIL